MVSNAPATETTHTPPRIRAVILFNQVIMSMNHTSHQESYFSPETTGLSFDLWLTLIRSDGTAFKSARSSAFGRLLAPDMDADRFDEIVRAEDRLADRVVEANGSNLDFNDRLNRIASSVGAVIPTEKQSRDLYDRQVELLEQFPPVLVHRQIPEALDSLASQYDLNITSNTGLIHGPETRRILANMGIDQYFSNMIFSDEVGYSKPSPIIFNSLLDHLGVPANQVAHIGDNWQIDVEGARANGLQAIFADRPEIVPEMAGLLGAEHDRSAS